MPISTIKASKATPGKAIDYILTKGKEGGWSVQNLDPYRDTGKQMMLTAKMWGKAQDENDRKYYHLKISFHPDDWTKNGGTLTEEDALEMCMRFMRENFPAHEGVGAIHTDKEHLHFHGIINAVNMENGSMLDVRNAEYRKIKDRVNEIAAERGLLTVDWRKATAQKRMEELQSDEPVSQTFAEKGLEERGAVSWKDSLRAIIDEASRTCCSMDEFKNALARKGVELTRCTGTTISYKLGEHRACRGDSLGGDYTVYAISQALKHNQAQMQREDRDKCREWGRLAGFKREEADAMYDMSVAATWAEKQKVWATYKAAKEAFWSDYQERRQKISEAMDEAYRRRQKAKDAEWVLNPRNRRRSLGGIIFAAIVLKKTGRSFIADQDIAMLRMQLEQLQKEAKEFKALSSNALETLRTKNLSLDTYMMSVQTMENIAEDAFAKEYAEYQRMMREIDKGRSKNNGPGLS